MATALQRIDGGFRHAVFEHEYARPRGAWPERNREMLGMPRRRVDRFLQVHVGVDVPQEKLRGPLILLVTAGRTPGHVRLTVTQRHRGRERGTGALAGRERWGMIFLKPEHLCAAAEAEADVRNDRRGLQPAAGWRRRNHIA